MRLMEAKLVLKSPAIITRRRVERGFVEPLEHVPGSMLRGAILTSLFRSGRLSREDLKREAEKPSLLASPAYPIVKGAKSLPATPFMFYCRKCNSIIDVTRESSEALLRNEEPKPPLTCEECKEPLKSLYGFIVAKSGDRVERIRVRTFRSTSVAIDKGRGSAMTGMLFDYEAIAEGTEFWAWVLAPEWLQADEMEVTVGRGSSRGFGWAELELREAPHTSQWLKAGQGDFVAISPLSPLKRIEWEGSTLTVTKVFGRTFRSQAGWDFMRGFRPIVELVKSGSIVLARASGDAIATLLHVGLPVKSGDSWLTGINVLLSIDEYYKLLGG